MQLFEPFRGFLAELKRRRVLEVVAIYGGLTFALLQSADIVVASLGISPTLLTALTLLVLFGFPVAVAVGWIYDIDSRGRLLRTLPVEPAESSADAAADEEAPRSLGWPVRMAAIAIGIVLVSASWFTAGRIQRAEAVEDPRGSYVVTPIAAGFQSPGDLQVANLAGRRLTRQLRGWETVRAVPSVALGGPRSRLGIKESEAPTLDQAFQIADSLGVGTLIALSLEMFGNEVDLEAVMYDVGRRREIDQSILVTGSAFDLDGLVAPVAFNILQLRSQVTSVEELRRESDNPAAHQAFEDGLDALHDWRLEEAEQYFRSAILKDPLFASAHHYLALTLYWQTSRDPNRILDVGHEIAHLTRAAIRLAGDQHARPGLQVHMQALNAFWQGDHDVARHAYQDILDKDPSDTEAWLLLGSVEYYDPMLREAAPDSFVPRRNLNVAREAFETAAELSPGWQISYGRLADIDWQLAEAAMGRGCPAFESSDRPGPSMFESREASDQVAFCPLVDDSVVWVEPSNIDVEQRHRAVENIERMLDRSRNLLEDWARIYPDQARPHDELATWLAWRRSMLGCKADATVARELTAKSLAERELSLALRADTTREDLVRLAVLRLATDEVDGARPLLEKALLDLPDGATVPDEAADVLLALGLPEQALEIMEPTWSTLTWAIEDPETNEYLAVGDVARPITELTMYGAMGPGPEIGRAFEALFEEWDSRGFSQRQAVHVRRAMLGQGIEPALALVSDVRARWFEGWDEVGVEVPTVWRGFLAADLAAGTEGEVSELESALDEVLGRLERGMVTSLKSHYLAALLAQLAGRHSAAVEQLLRVESCPIDLEGVSENLGLRTLGRWQLAQSYFALGDTLRAREALAGYSALRGDGGPMQSDPTRR